jgi:hypothetical protein
MKNVVAYLLNGVSKAQMRHELREALLRRSLLLSSASLSGAVSTTLAFRVRYARP